MRKRIRRGLIAGLLTVALLGVGADVWVARRPGPLFCPENARWVVAVRDFPAAYRRFLNSEPLKILDEQAPEYRADWQLAVRQNTGIRPTPLRWRVWLGRRFLGAVTDGGSGACLRPGVLLRVADAVRGLGRWRPAVRRFGPYYYGWRDGALVFSRSEQYVLDSLKAEPFSAPRTPAKQDLWFFETRDARSALGISPNPAIPCAGWIQNPFSKTRRLPAGLDVLPDDAAIAWAAAPGAGDLRALAEAIWQIADRHAGLAARPAFKLAVRLMGMAVRPWGFDELPADWERGVDGCLLALLDVDTSESLPVPSIAAMFRGNHLDRHPLKPLTGGGPNMPFEWDGRPGVMAPRAGEEATLCLTSRGPFWLAASQEPAMARLARIMDNAQEPVAQPADRVAMVALNWGKAAGAAEALARLAARLELLPPMNAADLEKNVVPLLRVAGKLGNARMDFTPSKDGRRLNFSGTLGAGP